MAQSSRVSMDETFVFLRKGSKRRPSQIAENTVDKEDVLCSIPKPSYKFLLILSIIQFLIIIAGLIAFGPLGHITCKSIVSEESKTIDGANSAEKITYAQNVFTNGPTWLTNLETKEDKTTSHVEKMMSTISKAQTSKDETNIITSKPSSSFRSTISQQNPNQPEKKNLNRSALGKGEPLTFKGKFNFVRYRYRLNIILGNIYFES